MRALEPSWFQLLPWNRQDSYVGKPVPEGVAHGFRPCWDRVLLLPPSVERGQFWSVQTNLNLRPLTCCRTPPLFWYHFFLPHHN